MLTKKDLLNQIEEYSIILNDYINKDFIYTVDTEYLEEEIKVISGCLLESIEELKEIIN